MFKTKCSTGAMALLFAGASFGFAQTSTFAVANAASWGPIVAPDAIAAGFGNNIASQQYLAFSTPLPATLGGVRLDVNDSGKATNTAGLFFVSSGQVNFLVPPAAAVGSASVFLNNGTGQLQGSMLVSNVAPGIFAANGNGSGAAAAQILQVPQTGAASFDNTFIGGASGYGTRPLTLAPGSSYYVVLYGTGIRRHSLNPVQASIGGTKVPVVYAGPTGGSLVGLDQVNIGPLPLSLAGTGKGDVDVLVTVDGVPANPVKINIQ